MLKDGSWVLRIKARRHPKNPLAIKPAIRTKDMAMRLKPQTYRPDPYFIRPYGTSLMIHYIPALSRDLLSKYPYWDLHINLIHDTYVILQGFLMPGGPVDVDDFAFPSQVVLRFIFRDVIDFPRQRPHSVDPFFDGFKGGIPRVAFRKVRQKELGIPADDL
jgi:hypothetical protein